MHNPVENIVGRFLLNRVMGIMSIRILFALYSLVVSIPCAAQGDSVVASHAAAISSVRGDFQQAVDEYGAEMGAVSAVGDSAIVLASSNGQAGVLETRYFQCYAMTSDTKTCYWSQRAEITLPSRGMIGAEGVLQKAFHAYLISSGRPSNYERCVSRPTDRELQSARKSEMAFKPGCQHIDVEWVPSGN